MAEEMERKSAGIPVARSPQDVWSLLRSDMDRLFDGFFGGGYPGLAGRFGAGVKMPSIDVREGEKEIVVEAELPGIDEKDISVTFKDGVLSIKGEKKSSREETKDEVHISERSYGSFQRALRVPETVEDAKIMASFDKGVLTVKLPKNGEAVRRERRIPIGGA